MTGKISKHKPKPPKIRVSEPTVIKEFKLHMVKESHHSLMVALFFIAAFTIYFLIKITLITLIEASQLLVVFGLIGFGLLFLLRKRLLLSVLDGMYYSTFAIAPISLALFLWVNTFSDDRQVETYKVIGLSPGGKGYVLELENDAYKEYWRIRNMSDPPSDPSNATISFTFSNGMFGYKVLENKELN